MPSLAPNTRLPAAGPGWSGEKATGTVSWPPAGTVTGSAGASTGANSGCVVDKEVTVTGRVAVTVTSSLDVVPSAVSGNVDGAAASGGADEVGPKATRRPSLVPA